MCVSDHLFVEQQVIPICCLHLSKGTFLHFIDYRNENDEAETMRPKIQKTISKDF